MHIVRDIKFGNASHAEKWKMLFRRVKGAIGLFNIAHLFFSEKKDFDIENDNINKAGGWVKNCRTVYFLTGAGMSAASGIPTFRGKNGLWVIGIPILLFTNSLLCSLLPLTIMYLEPTIMYGPQISLLVFFILLVGLTIFTMKKCRVKLSPRNVVRGVIMVLPIFYIPTMFMLSNLRSKLIISGSVIIYVIVNASPWVWGGLLSTPLGWIHFPRTSWIIFKLFFFDKVVWKRLKNDGYETIFSKFESIPEIKEYQQKQKELFERIVESTRVPVPIGIEITVEESGRWWVLIRKKLKILSETYKMKPESMDDFLDVEFIESILRLIEKEAFTEKLFSIYMSRIPDDMNNIFIRRFISMYISNDRKHRSLKTYHTLAMKIASKHKEKIGRRFGDSMILGFFVLFHIVRFEVNKIGEVDPFGMSFTDYEKKIKKEEKLKAKKTKKNTKKIKKMSLDEKIRSTEDELYEAIEKKDRSRVERLKHEISKLRKKRNEEKDRRKEEKRRKSCVIMQGLQD